MTEQLTPQPQPRNLISGTNVAKLSPLRDYFSQPRVLGELLELADTMKGKAGYDIYHTHYGDLVTDGNTLHHIVEAALPPDYVSTFDMQYFIGAIFAANGLGSIDTISGRIEYGGTNNANAEPIAQKLLRDLTYVATRTQYLANLMTNNRLKCSFNEGALLNNFLSPDNKSMEDFAKNALLIDTMPTPSFKAGQVCSIDFTADETNAHIKRCVEVFEALEDNLRAQLLFIDEASGASTYKDAASIPVQESIFTKTRENIATLCMRAGIPKTVFEQFVDASDWQTLLNHYYNVAFGFLREHELRENPIDSSRNKSIGLLTLDHLNYFLEEADEEAMNTFYLCLLVANPLLQRSDTFSPTSPMSPLGAVTHVRTGYCMWQLVHHAISAALNTKYCIRHVSITQEVLKHSKISLGPRALLDNDLRKNSFKEYKRLWDSFEMVLADDGATKVIYPTASSLQFIQGLAESINGYAALATGTSANPLLQHWINTDEEAREILETEGFPALIQHVNLRAQQRERQTFLLSPAQLHFIYDPFDYQNLAENIERAHREFGDVSYTEIHAASQFHEHSPANLPTSFSNMLNSPLFTARVEEMASTYDIGVALEAKFKDIGNQMVRNSTLLVADLHRNLKACEGENVKLQHAEAMRNGDMSQTHLAMAGSL